MFDAERPDDHVGSGIAPVFTRAMHRLRRDAAAGADLSAYSEAIDGVLFDAILAKLHADPRGNVHAARAWVDLVAAYVDAVEGAAVRVAVQQGSKP